MAFKVRLFPGAPDYETLHVAKLTCFPLETRDYRPYSQVRICFAADALHLQFLSFESKPLPNSRMEAILQFLDAGPPLRLSLQADGASMASAGDGSEPLDGVLVHTFEGEDLQGVYWGGNIIVSSHILGRCASGFSALPGATFRGNFYKTCENSRRPHYGCFFPADFSLSREDPRNFGEFVVIDY